jgi:hypothetical protein
MRGLGCRQQLEVDPIFRRFRDPAPSPAATAINYLEHIGSDEIPQMMLYRSFRQAR